MTVIGAVRPLEELQPGDTVVVQAEAGRTVELMVGAAYASTDSSSLVVVVVAGRPGTGVLSARYVEDQA